MMSAMISTIVVGVVALVMAFDSDNSDINANIEKEFDGLDEGTEIFFPSGRTYRKTSNGIIEVKAA